MPCSHNPWQKEHSADSVTGAEAKDVSVEEPVRLIMKKFVQVDEVRSVFNMGHGIIFENHPHAISDVSDEVAERDILLPPQTPGRTLDRNQLRPDQICVYLSDDADEMTRTMIYVCEYKPPHKLTAPHLRLGLRPMNIPEEVVNQKTIPTAADQVGLFQYYADLLTASAVTQTYHYMMEGGLEYGLLTTGEAIVFLNVDWRDPETLYYHLAEPGPEVSAHPDNSVVCVAVGQYLAFSLMAMGRRGERRAHGQAEREQVKHALSTWRADFSTTHLSVPAQHRRASISSAAYKNPTTYKEINRSPYLFRKHGVQPSADHVEREEPRRDPSESSDDDVAGPGTPTPAGRRPRGAGQEPRRSERIQSRQSDKGGGGGGSRDSEQRRAYCTQKCLLGLVRGDLLDLECPNVALHRKKDRARDSNRGRSRAIARVGALAHAYHPVHIAKWLELLRKQLQRSLDDGITALGIGGARGVLFRVTMLAYGYTFIGKGTVRAFIPDLELEAAVYERLRPIQGVNVPVFLGAIDLRTMNKIYYYDHRVYVVHMTFLSWGGLCINPEKTVDKEGRLLGDKAVQSLEAVHQLGVVHKDARVANMLFSPETDGVMLIDFERSQLVRPPRRPPMVQLVPNKRARDSETVDAKNMIQAAPIRDRTNRGFAQDMLTANIDFFIR